MSIIVVTKYNLFVLEMSTILQVTLEHGIWSHVYKRIFDLLSNCILSLNNE